MAGAAAPAAAQRRVPIVGFLTSAGEESLAQFREAMGAIGHVEGTSYRIELRSARGQPDRLPALARELTALPVDVIYATGPPAVAASYAVAGTVPIVAFDLESDPVASGFVQSLAQPC